MLTFLNSITPQATGKIVLVLLHAFPLSSEMYRKSTLHITKAHAALPIITVDLPGFGNAPVTDSWTIDAAMADLHEQLAQQGATSVVIGGTSMGGYATFSFYRQFPEEVKGLIFSNTKAEADTEEAKADREVFAKDVTKRGHDAVYERMLDKLVSPDTAVEVKDVVKRSIASQSTDAIAAGLRAMAVRTDSTDLLEKITCPTLVIASQNDQLMKAEALQSIADNTKDSTLVKLPSIGHLAPLEAPEPWASAVSSFLQTNALI